MRNKACLAAVFVAAFVVLSEAKAGNLHEPASCDEIARAGWPWCQWKWAQLQDPCDYSGYYVGGGTSGPRAREHCDCEGTWGWDYQGRNLKRFVNLGWTTPPRRQGGTGSYQPDGPRVLEAAHERIHSHHAAE